MLGTCGTRLVRRRFFSPKCTLYYYSLLSLTYSSLVDRLLCMFSPTSWFCNIIRCSCDFFAQIAILELLKLRIICSLNTKLFSVRDAMAGIYCHMISHQSDWRTLVCFMIAHLPKDSALWLIKCTLLLCGQFLISTLATISHLQWLNTCNTIFIRETSKWVWL